MKSAAMKKGAATSMTEGRTDPSRVPTAELVQDVRFWREALLFAVLVLLGLGLCLAATIEGPGRGLLPALSSRALRIAIGLLVFFAAVRFPWEALRPQLGRVFAVVLGLCVLPILLGDPTKGATRWIEAGPLSFQPVELLKPLTVLAVAEFGLRRQRHMHELWRGFVPAMLPVFAATFVLLLQPDVGHAVFLLTIAVAVLLLAGMRWSHCLGLAVLCGSGIGALMLFGYEHTWRRIAGFLGEEPSFQIQRAQIALREGGLLGVGPGESWVKMGYVPEARNDFVLAILGNEFGLVGSLLAIACFAVLFVASLRIARAAATDWERLVALGLGAMLVLQVALNVLGVTHTIPEKGIDLPLLSSGGTNLVFALASMGILSRIAVRAGSGPAMS